MDYSKCKKRLGVNEKFTSFIFLFLLAKYFERSIRKSFYSRRAIKVNLDENLAGKNPNPTDKGAYQIATLTWILTYEKGNGRNTKGIQDTFYKLLSDAYQDKAPSLGFVPLKGDILEKSRDAVKKIGR